MGEFRFTPIQEQAITLAGSGATDIMLFGGSRSGKTFVFICMICVIAEFFPGIRIVVLRRYLKDVRESIVMDTFPKAMKLRCHWDGRLINKCLNRNDMVFHHPNGSEIWFAGLDDNDRVEKILGKEYGLIYFNECSQILYSSIETAKTRLAQKVDGWRNKCFYDCNPPSKAHWTYKIFQEHLNPDKTPLAFPDDYVSLQMNPQDNAENISADYLERTLAGLKGKARERFLLGNWTDENENALWKATTMIDPYRVQAPPEDLERIVVGVDPAVTSKVMSDYTGIVVAGKRYDPNDEKTHYYVMADRSIQGSPNLWATIIANTFAEYQADRVVAEVNQGGDLVVETLRHVSANLPIRTVRATRGKMVRAEPIAALYENGLVHHVGEFPDLEEEMTSYTGANADESPDRMDALVWALTELADYGSLKVQRFSWN